MNTWTLRAALACLAVPLCAPLHAEEGKPFTLQDALGSDSLSIKGSFRVRYESFDSDFRPGGPAGADLLTLRTDIEAEYRTGALRLGAELRDVRAYLGESSTPFGSSDVNALEPIQLYAAVSLGALAGGKDAEITAGRFLLNLGSKRLAGDPGFRSTANAFTGVRFDWTGASKEKLTLFYTYPQQRLPGDKASILENRVELDRESDDLVFWGGFASLPKAIGPLTAEVYLYGLDENDRPDQATRNRHLVTPGLRLFVKPSAGKPDGELELAWQTGSIRASSAANAARLGVTAYTAHAELGYSFASGWTPRLAGLFDLASGDHAGSGRYNRFDSLFGPRRSDWGPTGIFGPLTRSNIVSAGLKLEVTPSKRVDAFVAWRNLWLDSATDSFSKTGVKDATGLSGRHAGHHVEARMRYWILPKQLRLDTGGALLLKGKFLSDAPNAPNTRTSAYGYTDLTLSF